MFFVTTDPASNLSTSLRTTAKQREGVSGQQEVTAESKDTLRLHATLCGPIMVSGFPVCHELLAEVLEVWIKDKKSRNLLHQMTNENSIETKRWLLCTNLSTKRENMFEFEDDIVWQFAAWEFVFEDDDEDDGGGGTEEGEGASFTFDSPMEPECHQQGVGSYATRK